MAQPLELKKTLNLPKTDFPMKAGLPQNEPNQLEAWHRGNIYERILETRQGKPLFVLHDGPPYPTGEIHLGTGLNKILKDLVVKTKSMAGHYAPYVPGWDCHGLPIETQVEKELGGKGKVPPAQFRKLCRQFAVRYVEQHKKDFKRLGIFGRWNDPYLTMSHEYEATTAGASRSTGAFMTAPRSPKPKSSTKITPAHQFTCDINLCRTERTRTKFPPSLKGRMSTPLSGPRRHGRFPPAWRLRLIQLLSMRPSKPTVRWKSLRTSFNTPFGRR